MSLPELPSFNIQKTPRKTLDKYKLKEIFEECPESVKEYARILLSHDWKIKVAKQNNGWCLVRERMIVLPEWLWVPWSKEAARLGAQPGYKVWYIAHELAHAFDFKVNGWNKDRGPHDEFFMAQLKRICPENVIHYELEYKPRLAKAAGISNPKDKQNQLPEL